MRERAMEHNWSRESRSEAVGELDQPAEPTLHARLRGGRIGAGRQLAEGQRRVPDAQLGRLSQACVQVADRTAGPKLADRLELRPCSPAGANEVGVVGIHKP